MEVVEKRNIRKFIGYAWLVCMLLLILQVVPVVAVYDYAGIPLTNVRHETLNGGVYVDGGHGLAASPYTQAFTVPSGTIRYAKLYVGVWGTDNVSTGNISTQINSVDLGSISLLGENDLNSNVYVAGSGVYWVSYNVTDKVTSGSNTAIATTNGTIDGRVYAIVLVAVYENASMPQVEYWINEGNEYLNSKAQNNTTTIFNGTVGITEIESAKLWTSYIGGSAGNNDTLSMNGDIVATDATDGAEGSYFDMDEWNVTDVLASSDNSVEFDRVNDSTLFPVSAVLVVTRKPNGYFGNNPMTIYRHEKINGDLMYSLGNSTYTGGLTTDAVYPVETNITIPTGYSVRVARLYTYWTWSKDTVTSTGIDAQMEVTFDGTIIASDKNYSDRKGFGTYDYPYGTYAYNVTDIVTATKNYTTVVKNIGTDKSFSMYGVGLLVVLENSGAEEIEYWIAEGADIISSKDTYGTTPETATTYVDFSGSIDTNAVKNATLVSVVQGADKGDLDMNELIFNTRNWIGALDAPSSQQQIAVDNRDVGSYLESSNNMAGIRDIGDSMMAVNAFLVINFTSTLSISASPTNVDVGIPTDVTFTVTNNSIPVEGAAISLSGSATGSGTTNAQGTAIISINATSEGTITATATKDEISGTTTLTASPQSDSSSVSLSATIVPAISLVVTPGTLNFGMLSVGETSSVNTLTLDNQGGYDISVTTDVKDTANDLFVDGIMLNSASWNSYSIFMAAHTSTTSNVALQVPNNYIGVGAQQGTLVFWAQQS